MSKAGLLAALLTAACAGGGAEVKQRPEPESELSAGEGIPIVIPSSAEPPAGVRGQTEVSQAEPSPEPTPSPAKETAAEPQAEEASDPDVRLVQAGAEPRVKLRLHPAAGSREATEANMKVSMTMDMGGSTTNMDMPEIHIETDTDVTSVDGAGLIDFSTVISDASVGAGGDPLFARLLQQSLADIKGLTAKGTVTARGVSKKLDVSAGGDKVGDQLRDWIRLSGALPTFPAEVVGKGATWQSTHTFGASGESSMQLTVDYELLDLQGDHARVRVTISGKANTSSGSASMSATSDIDVSLAHLFARSAATDIQMTVDSSRGMRTKMSMHFDVATHD